MDGFVEYYEGTRGRVLRTVSAVALSPQDAQDCVQEAYVRAAMRWRQVQATDDPEAWVRRVALNLAMDGYRRRRVRLAFLSGRREQAHTPPPGADRIDVVRAVRRLPRAQQEVIVRHYLLDMPVAEVALDLDRPENTVKTQLARARARLGELLHDDDKAMAND